VTAGLLRLRRTATGRTRQILVDVDADAFADTWLDCIEALP
jgi:hypothetical protein